VHHAQNVLSLLSKELYSLKDENGLHTALATLNTNQERARSGNVYFDENRDKADITTYYRRIDFAAEEKDSLFRKLNDLITRTHTNQPSYDESRYKYLYLWVDLHEDGNIHSIYSGNIREPEQLLREDYETEIKRMEASNALLGASSPLTDLQAREMIANIENNYKYNCEHVVPQSWFFKANPMRGDLHHLFACEPTCNSTRSNYPYYDFADYEPMDVMRIIKGSCGKYDNGKFEPETGKGAVARATLYFLLRYPGKITRYSKEDIHMLLSWHQKFPVSLYEKHRNQAIFDIQHNRNPLIDFPQYVDHIDFILGL
jgi:deoxyribonuclease-1